jgi:hypothetical protein
MKEYKPTPKMRTNVLSTTPGGSVVKVFYEGYSVIYDNVKYVNSYLSKLNQNENIILVEVNGSPYDLTKFKKL